MTVATWHRMQPLRTQVFFFLPILFSYLSRVSFLTHILCVQVFRKFFYLFYGTSYEFGYVCYVFIAFLEFVLLAYCWRGVLRSILFDVLDSWVCIANNSQSKISHSLYLNQLSIQISFICMEFSF